MDNRLEKAKDWIGERGVPYEGRLAEMSDRLDEIKERREQKKTTDGEERSDQDEGGQDEPS